MQPIYYPFLLHSEAALDVSIDVHVASPDVEAPPTPPGDRWRHRIADLGPFATIDAAASCNTDRSKLTLTAVNRGPEVPDRVEVRLRDAVFTSEARMRTITGSSDLAQRPAPDVEGVNLKEDLVSPGNGALVVELPPRSFTVIEVPIAVR